MVTFQRKCDKEQYNQKRLLWKIYSYKLKEKQEMEGNLVGQE